MTLSVSSTTTEPKEYSYEVYVLGECLAVKGFESELEAILAAQKHLKKYLRHAEENLKKQIEAIQKIRDLDLDILEFN